MRTRPTPEHWESWPTETKRRQVMIDKTMLAVLATGVALAAPPSVAAQQWGRGPFPRDGVCFFKDPDFKGDYFCAGAGETAVSVPSDINDEISSIRIFGRADVSVFKDPRFGGNSVRYRGNIADLKHEGWDD